MCMRVTETSISTPNIIILDAYQPQFSMKKENTSRAKASICKIQLSVFFVDAVTVAVAFIIIILIMHENLIPWKCFPQYTETEM